MNNSTYQNFTVDIENISSKKNDLKFEIKGNMDYGLDKSFINGIRRILLTDIETVAFDDDNIIIDKNTGSLHNEFLKSRIALIPLYINPDDYYNQYLFELNIEDFSEPIINITADMFNIYGLNKDTINIIKKQESMGDIPDEENILVKLKSINTEYYDLDNKLSDNLKKKIFKPFEYNGKDNYFLITELKNTNSDTDKEMIKLYAKPNIGTSKQHARYNNLSTVLYTFKKNEEEFKNSLKNELIINKINKDKNIEEFSKSYYISNSERFFEKDNNLEPFWYNFNIVSNHFNTPKECLIKSINIFIAKFDTINIKIKEMLQQSDKSVGYYNINKMNDNDVYKLHISDQDSTTGYLIQSHAVKHYINKDSFVQICGFNKPHPLINNIVLNFMVNPTEYNELQKITYISEFITNIINDIKNILLIIRDNINDSI